MYAALMQKQPRGDFSTHVMLGYLDMRDHGGWPKFQLPERELLLDVGSDDRARMNFGDAGRQCFHMDLASLAERDFAKATTECGV